MFYHKSIRNKPIRAKPLAQIGFSSKAFVFPLNTYKYNRTCSKTQAFLLDFGLFLLLTRDLRGNNMSNAKENVIRLWKEYRPDIQSIAELERKMDLSNGIISKWATKRPSTKSAQKVADFFKVPLGEVLSDVSDEQVSLDSNDQRVLAMFRKQTEGMTDQQKDDFQDSLEDVMTFAKKLVQERKGK